MAKKSQLDILIELYQEAQLELIKIIGGNHGAGTKTYYNSVLKQLEKLMQELENKTGKYIQTEIPAEYKKALDETYAYFQRNHLQMNRPDMFAQIHSDAVYELSREMQFNIDQGISQAGRRVIRYLEESRDNILRQQGLRSAAVKIASGQTVADMQKDLMQKLTEDGFLTVQYGSGNKAYQIGLDTYTAMVARSTTREAGNLARENQLKDNGYDLMKMTEHYPTCSKCASLQGRVYSISGKDKRFPPLSRAFSSGYRNVHPNCRHVMTYYVESMQSPRELKTDIANSNKPFEDSRSDAEKASYTESQANNRRMRADRSQYERYKARLGDDAPKSFHGFRKMKKANGEAWNDLQKLYRSKFEKSVDKSAKGGIIKSLDIDDFEMMAEGRDIDKNAIDIISSVVNRYEKTGEIYINDFYFGSLPKGTSGTPLLQIEPIADKTLRLNVNTDVFEGRTVEQINEMLASFNGNLANDLEEAVIHECGHAKSIKGKTIKEIETMYAEIVNANIKGISKIAYNDGAEALAEIEILISRGLEVPEDTMKFYIKYMGGK